MYIQMKPVWKISQRPSDPHPVTVHGVPEVAVQDFSLSLVTQVPFHDLLVVRRTDGLCI